MCSKISDKEIYQLIKKREEENKVFRKLLHELKSRNKITKSKKKKIRS